MLYRRSRAVKRVPASHPLAGKKVWVPRMSYGSARAFAAALRSIGIAAECTPPSDKRTLELGGRFTSGDECYPLKVTLGDFLKLLEEPGADPAKMVLFMPTAEGPCRFGQYAPYIQRMLVVAGYPEAQVFSPNSRGGYSDWGELAHVFLRSGWRALVAGDILLKLLLKTRPYEAMPGSADDAYETSVKDLCESLEVSYPTAKKQLEALRTCLTRARDRFRSVPARYNPERPLVAIVGEIFCRLNTFSNDEILRRLEEYGAETWMSDITEWIWYANSEQLRRLQITGKSFSGEMLGARLRTRIQKRDEHELLSLFREDFHGYEEPEDISIVLGNAQPYLPPEGAFGEMVVNVGRSIYLAKKGVDAVLDISPFTCMNGIVCEAIYPRVSADLGGIPIRNFYFDGTQANLERDIGIYLELARTYRTRKPYARTFPDCFPKSVSASFAHTRA